MLYAKAKARKAGILVGFMVRQLVGLLEIRFIPACGYKYEKKAAVPFLRSPVMSQED
jgi:hypothetical protein